MSNVGELIIQLALNVARLQSDTRKSQRIVEDASKRMKSSFDSVRNAFAAIGIGLSGAAIVNSIRNTIDAADSMSKLAQKTGVAVEELSALQYAGKLADVGVEQLQMGIRQLSVNMFDTARGTGEAKDAFDAMGISVKDQNGNLKSATAIIREVADKFAGMEDGLGKSALAAKIFGTRVGSELIPLLNEGSAGLDGMRKEAERLGIIIDGKTGKAAEDFNDNLTRLSESIEGLKISAGGPVLESLTNFTQKLLDGRLAAGGFLSAIIDLGQINPYKTVGENLRSINAELEQLKNYDPFRLTSQGILAVDSRIRTLEAQKQYLQAQQRAEALAPTAGQILDPRDYLARGGMPKKPAPLIAPKPKKTEQIDLPQFNTAGKVEELFKPYREQALAEDLQHARDLERDFTQGVEEDGRRHMEALKKLWDAKDQADEFEKAQAKMKKVGRDTAEELKAAFEGFGRDTSRALAEMATSGSASFSSLRDVARLFFTELIEKILYTQAIAPALDFLTTSFGLSTGGAKAFGGPVSPGVSYPVGEHGPEMFVPNVPGDIVPVGGGLSVSVVQHIRVDARSDRASVIAAMNQAREAAKADILRSLQNGGTFAAAMGRV